MSAVSVWPLTTFSVSLKKLSRCFQKWFFTYRKIRVIVFSEMNRCSKSGIHEHSPNSQIHIQIFHRIARLSSTDFPDLGEDGFRTNGMCVAIFEDNVTMSLLYPFWLFFSTEELAPCARVCSQTAFASFSRTWEVDAASNEFGWIDTAVGFPEAIGIPRLLDAIGLDAVEEHVAMEEDRFIAAGRDLDANLFSSSATLIKLKFLVQQVELKWLT